MKWRWRESTTNAPRTIRVEDGNWAVCYPPRDLEELMPAMRRAFPARRYWRLEWTVYAEPANARNLLAFAERFNFEVTPEARALVETVLAGVAESGARPDRTITVGVNKDGLPAYLIHFGYKDTDPEFDAVHARVVQLPGAQYLRRAWAVEKIHREAVLAFATEFQFTLPPELQGAAAGGSNEQHLPDVPERGQHSPIQAGEDDAVALRDVDRGDGDDRRV